MIFRREHTDVGSRLHHDFHPEPVETPDIDDLIYDEYETLSVSER